MTNHYPSGNFTVSERMQKAFLDPGLLPTPKPKEIARVSPFYSGFCYTCYNCGYAVKWTEKGKPYHGTSMDVRCILL